MNAGSLTILQLEERERIWYMTLDLVFHDDTGGFIECVVPVAFHYQGLLIHMKQGLHLVDDLFHARGKKPKLKGTTALDKAISVFQEEDAAHQAIKALRDLDGSVPAGLLLNCDQANLVAEDTCSTRTGKNLCRKPC